MECAQLLAWSLEHSERAAAFCFVCQIFYYRPGQRCLYPFLSTNWTFLYYTECIILSIPKRAHLKSRIKCSYYFWKSSGKRVYPYPLVTLCKMCGIIKIMEYDFKSELEDELGKLLFLYDFCYFNNKVTEEELREIGRLIRTHREVIKVLGKWDKIKEAKRANL